MRLKFVLSGLLIFALSLHSETLSPEVRAALDSIQPADLKGDLSFLASDLLQGRFTPSPGLDIAAEFIASRFRAIGLEPINSNGYFQIAPMVDRHLPKITAPLTARDGDTSITVAPNDLQFAAGSRSLHLEDAPVLKMTATDLASEKPDELSGKVILLDTSESTCFAAGEDPADDECAQIRSFQRKLGAAKALLEIQLVPKIYHGEPARLLTSDQAHSPAPPLLHVASPQLAAALRSPAPLTLSLDIPAPDDREVNLKNVIGILPGADPALRSTAVLVSAHYDHIGTAETSAGLTYSKPTATDKIFNGANDDGSGTVSVIEIARALAHLHAKRSIVFITFFGEERGLIGSTWYGAHPVFPIAATIADINLEQVGRTDSNKGPEIANATVTGYDYSDVTRYLEAAGKQTGIDIYQDPAPDDEFFMLSDNGALARLGIPAHTIATAFEYPDYHAVGDEWQKIDFANMAKVDRAIALAILNLANSKHPPKWNTENPKTAPYRRPF